MGAVKRCRSLAICVLASMQSSESLGRLCADRFANTAVQFWLGSDLFAFPVSQSVWNRSRYFADIPETALDRLFRLLQFPLDSSSSTNVRRTPRRAQNSSEGNQRPRFAFARIRLEHFQVLGSHCESFGESTHHLPPPARFAVLRSKLALFPCDDEPPLANDRSLASRISFPMIALRRQKTCPCCRL